MRRVARVLAVLFGGFASLSVGASIILAPVNATTDMGVLGGSAINHMYDRSGLSVSYTNLVTVFETYSATHATGSGSNSWTSTTNKPTGNVDFDLGGTYPVRALAFWNSSLTGASRVGAFTLFASLDSSFTSSTNLGSFSTNTTGTAIPEETFTFAPASAAFIRMNITGNTGGANLTAIGEVAFAVPEPNLLAVAGLGSLAALRRPRRASGHVG